MKSVLIFIITKMLSIEERLWNLTLNEWEKGSKFKQSLAYFEYNEVLKELKANKND